MPAGVDRPSRRLCVLLERQFQRTVATELRAAGVQVRSQRRDDRTRPHLVDGRRARVAEDALAVRIGAPAHQPTVAEHDERAPRPAALKPGGQKVQGHRRLMACSHIIPRCACSRFSSRWSHSRLSGSRTSIAPRRRRVPSTCTSSRSTWRRRACASSCRRRRAAGKS